MIDKKDEAMTSANTDKAVDGNAFQNNFMAKVQAVVGESAVLQNNKKYTITVRRFTKGTNADIEMAFKRNLKTKIFFEVTTSIRDDRFEAKDSQAEGIINEVEKDGLQVIYCLVVPDDYTVIFKNVNREINMNNRFAEKVNFQRRPLIHDHKFIHLMLKESQALEFTRYLNTIDVLTEEDVINAIDYCRDNIVSK